ncbi:MAG: GH12 family glycosyl hydrolase domain-containing protein [Polyangiaceae bacterium]
MRLVRLFVPPFVLATLAACAATSTGPGHAAGVPGGSDHCGQFDNVEVRGKEYVIQTNEWNSTQTQCLSVNETAFAVTEANFSLPSAGPPASYPSIFKGCHWGNCTSHSGLPVQASSLPAVPSRWTVTSSLSGAYDIAYDLWFNQTATTSGQPNGTELMIWLNHRGGVQPAGAQIGTVSIAGATWDVWKGPMSGWTYIAYVRQTPADAVDLDLRAFTQDAIARGTINPAWYLVDIEAGFEIWQGGSGLATTSFSATVGGA